MEFSYSEWEKEALKEVARLREEIAQIRAHDEPMIAALHEGQEKLRRELESTKEEYDGTDGAHICWWRGSDHAAKNIAVLLQKCIDGEDGGHGIIAHLGLEAIRRWILARNSKP